MRNLWLLISKYNAFFLFIVFFLTSLFLFVSNNPFQKAVVLNTSNQMIGEAYQTIHNLQSYLHLSKVNDSLARENARLRSLLPSAYYVDSVEVQTTRDTILKQQYTYIVAQVINNSIHLGDNVITINRGKRHGIERGMGVICSSGVVGIVLDVSNNFATIQSLLNSRTKISASIQENNAFGSLVWGEDNHDHTIAILKDIPNHVNVKKGQNIITSGYSTLFPRGLPIGKVHRTGITGGESFLDIEVKLSTDFATLQYVYVIKNFFAIEKQQLEVPTPTK